MTDLKKTVGDKKADVEKRFDEQKKLKEQLQENGKQIQTQMNEVDSELVRLQGEFRALDDLVKPEEKPLKGKIVGTKEIKA